MKVRTGFVSNSSSSSFVISKDEYASCRFEIRTITWNCDKMKAWRQRILDNDRECPFYQIGR
jgi:hypothetical protein